MNSEKGKSIFLVVEGDLDELVVRTLLKRRKIYPEVVLGKRGKGEIIRNLQIFNQRAKYSSAPWIILVDLDQDEECAAPFVRRRLSNPSAGLFFRVAVHSLESWLLADRQRLASFLRISADIIPLKIEEDKKPKTTMVNLARRSSSLTIKQDMVPREGSRASQGKAYNSRMEEFVAKYWRPEVAAQNADSLRRFLKVLDKISLKED